MAKAKIEKIGRTVTYKDTAANPVLADTGFKEGDTILVEDGKKIADLTKDEIEKAWKEKTSATPQEDVVDESSYKNVAGSDSQVKPDAEQGEEAPEENK